MDDQRKNEKLEQEQLLQQSEQNNNASQPRQDQIQQSEQAQQSEHKSSSVYYSYGPYKSNAQEIGSNSLKFSEQQKDNNETMDVEFAPTSKILISNQESTINLSKKSKQKLSFRNGIVAGLLVGALFVSGLVVTSERNDFFSYNSAEANNQSVNSTQESSDADTNRNVTDNNASTPSINTTKNAAVTNNSNSATTYEVVRPNHIADMVKKTSPAVVKIEAFTKVNNTSRRGSSLLDDPFFRQFFEEETPIEPKSSNGGSLQQSGMGTGFIFEKSGYILTNEHVINGADEIRVTVEGYEKPFVAKLLGNSYDLDLAVLKIEATKEFSVLPLGNTDNTNVGDWVVAIGNPYGFEHTVTVGVLSAKERPISIPDENGTRNYNHLLQTDASINPGNSGGPLLNLAGEVIGINTAVSAQAQGIGFAIPTSTITSVLENLKNNVVIPKEPAPYIGVSLQDIDQAWISDLKLSNTDGALIATIERKSPAFAAGLRPYDVIIEVNGTKIKNANELITKIKTYKVGEKVKIAVIRNGSRMEVTVDIGDRNKK